MSEVYGSSAKLKEVMELGGERGRINHGATRRIFVIPSVTWARMTRAIYDGHAVSYSEVVRQSLEGWLAERDL